MKVIGIILIIIGIAMIVLKGFNFQTEKEVADIGPVEINKTESHHVGWPTYVGGVVTIVGVVLVVAGAKTGKKSAA